MILLIVASTLSPNSTVLCSSGSPISKWCQSPQNGSDMAAIARNGLFWPGQLRPHNTADLAFDRTTKQFHEWTRQRKSSRTVTKLRAWLVFYSALEIDYDRTL
jgi:hypothetical protein